MLRRNDYHIAFFAALIYNTNKNLQQFTNVLSRKHMSTTIGQHKHALAYPGGGGAPGGPMIFLMPKTLNFLNF